MTTKTALSLALMMLGTGCTLLDEDTTSETGSKLGAVDAPAREPASSTAPPDSSEPPAPAAAPTPPAPETGVVFTLSNDATKNEVLAFTRSADGSLAPAGAFATGGKGTGAGLGSQGALALSPDGRFLLAVDAGSNEVTSFAVDGAKLTLRSHVSSDGTMPVSVAVTNGLAYVVNAADTNCITGFRLGEDGTLTEIAASKHSLSAKTVGPAQVSFSPDGRTLVVTEKMTNKIDLFAVNADGTVSNGYADLSAGMTPFGFAFSPDAHLVVTEAFGAMPGASATSSYDLVMSRDVVEPVLSAVSRSVKTNQTAACWIAITDDGKWAFTANTPNHTVSAYSIADGALALRGDGAALMTGEGTRPTDLALDRGSKHLFSLNSGTHEIAAYDVKSDGSLSPVATNVKIPEFAQGLVAR